MPATQGKGMKWTAVELSQKTGAEFRERATVELQILTHIHTWASSRTRSGSACTLRQKREKRFSGAIWRIWHMPPAAGRHRSLIANSLRAILTVETGLLASGVFTKGEKIVSIDCFEWSGRHL